MRQVDMNVVCEGLVAKIFHESCQGDPAKGVVVVVTASHPGAGVSQVTRILADAFGQKEDLALALDFRALRSSTSQLSSVGEVFSEDQKASELQRFDRIAGNWHAVQMDLASQLERLRRQYRYVLIDCPSLKETHDAIRLAPLVDGIVLIVEANRTQRDQLRYAERVITEAKGRILGLVLNKRTYPVPEWIQRKMDSIGI